MTPEVPQFKIFLAIIIEWQDFIKNTLRVLYLRNEMVSYILGINLNYPTVAVFAAFGAWLSVTCRTGANGHRRL